MKVNGKYLGGDTECSRKYADTYNKTSDTCHCGSRPSCLFTLPTAPFCDNELGMCKCSKNEDACNNPGEICIEGRCMCGASQGCAKSLTAPFCDAENHVCKCSIDEPECTIPNEKCTGGECRCGNGDSCKDRQKHAPYCDVSSSTCKCSANVDACNPDDELCIDGECQKRKCFDNIQHTRYFS